MSIQFWGTVQSRIRDMRSVFGKHSGEHAISLISPNTREIVEGSEEGVWLYSKDSDDGSLSVRVCQLRVAESPNTAQRFPLCQFGWGMGISDVTCTGRRSPLTMRQFAVQDIGLPPCFDWWINRHASSLPLSLVIKADEERGHLPADRYGDSLVSLTLDGQRALHNIQISGTIASVRNLQLLGSGEVTADDLHCFPKLERLHVTQIRYRLWGSGMKFCTSWTCGGTEKLSSCKHLQHLFINDCSHVCLLELPILFPHLQTLSLRGSNLKSPLHFPPEMQQLTHLDLLVQNPERIGQLPHSPNLRFLALKDLDMTVVRTILHGSKFLRHLEGHINSVASFDITSWEPIIDVLDVLRIHDSPQLRNLVFSTCDSLLHLMSLDVSRNYQLRTLDISGCVNLTKLDCCCCPQLREVVGLAGLDKLEKLYTYRNDNITSLDVRGCVSLADLQFNRCTQLRNVVGLARLANLQMLHAYDNPKLTSLDVSGCVSLQLLLCYRCEALATIVGLAGLDTLETLHAYENPMLTSLDVSGCISLREFACCKCAELTEIIGLAGLKKLATLRAFENPKLTTLDVSDCVSLTDLKFSGCPELCEVVGVSGLVDLKMLHAYENPKLTTLDVSGCTNLKEFKCHGCPQLRNVVGLDQIPAVKASVLRQLSHGGGGWCSLQ